MPPRAAAVDRPSTWMPQNQPPGQAGGGGFYGPRLDDRWNLISSTCYRGTPKCALVSLIELLWLALGMRKRLMPSVKPISSFTDSSAIPPS